MATQRRARIDQRKVARVEQEKKSWPVYPIIAVLSFLGLMDATFLVVEYLLDKEACSPTRFFNCSMVLNSKYSKIGWVPLSEVGAAAYFIVFSLAVLAAYNYKIAARYLPAILTLMFLTSLYLFYLQAFEIGAFCVFCLISAGITTLMTAVIWTAKFLKRV